VPAGAYETHSTIVPLSPEMVIPQHDRDFIGNWADLEMLLGASGRERSTAEYRDLLGQGGFNMTRVVQTASPFSLIEAKPD
jgi:hypothetical protein